MPHQMSAGDVLDGRYRLDDLLDESASGRFWRGWDSVLSRPVAIHVLAASDDAVAPVLAAARGSARLHDPRVLRVLDATERDDLAWVVNEWGQGVSLDIVLAEGPLEPRRAAHIVAEVADTVAAAHAVDLAHGRLNPENVLIDRHGGVRIIGFGVDAALHGLPPGRTSADVDDLVGLLYAGLTGRWAGTSISAIAGAPTESGDVLRPRRVRAGIPRLLDGMCDQRLNPTSALGHHRSDRDWSTARGLADELADFVGDPTGLLTALVGAAPATLGAPSGPRPPGADSPTVTVEAVQPEPEQPTEAGLPVFHDDDEVGWVSRDGQRSTPPPPPPFDPTPERPLFAPDPPEGRAPRRPRGPDAASGVSDQWRWAEDDPRATSGSGVLLLEDEPEPVPGRSWLRLALLVGLCAVLLVAAVSAVYLGGGLTLPSDDPEPGTDTSSQEPPAEPEPYADLSADDFDPEGGADGENPDTVGAVVDGDATTTWTTSTYFDPIDLLKSGVGVVVDLGRVGDVREVELELLGGTTAFSLYVTREAPTTVEGLDPVAEEQGSGTISLDLDDARGRYVTLWLTELPAVEGGFRGEVAEIGIAG